MPLRLLRRGRTQISEPRLDVTNGCAQLLHLRFQKLPFLLGSAIEQTPSPRGRIAGTKPAR